MAELDNILRGNVIERIRAEAMLSPYVGELPPHVRESVCEWCLSWREHVINNPHPRFFSDPVHGEMMFEPDEVILIDSCYLQRLRYISQVSFLHHVFPSAKHDRFQHSLGTAYIAKRIMDSPYLREDLRDFFNWLLEIKNLELPGDLVEKLIELERKVIIYSALLHDIGHFPFSHDGERIYYILRQILKDTKRKEELILRVYPEILPRDVRAEEDRRFF